MPSLLDLLGQTWPARMAKSAYGAVTLPGDVYAGRVDPLSEEGIGRAADLGGLVMGGTYAGAPAGAVGAGAVRHRLEITRKEPAGSQYPNSYVLTDPSGREVARMTAKIEGDTAKIENIFTDRNPALAAPGAEREAILAQQRNTLGPAVLRDVLQQFREQHPEIKNIVGERVSGARQGGGYTTDKGAETRLRIGRQKYGDEE